MKRKFIVIVLFLLAAVVCTGAAYFYFNSPTSSKRLPDRYLFPVPQLVSDHDEDGDGIDDQTDLLQGTLAYIGTRPKYKSQYYDGGYPDDGYGVCTDVVAAAMISAGYDLRELVDADVRKRPEAYDIQKRDSNIDYRRVDNLKVYFEKYALSLTIDPKQIDQWQGGDIVVFAGHIGMVSDHRNIRGVPYVIHHNSPFQRRYEEDILEKRNDIAGHYRITGFNIGNDTGGY